jgi:hypothetical protein
MLARLRNTAKFNACHLMELSRNYLPNYAPVWKAKIRKIAANFANSRQLGFPCSNSRAKRYVTSLHSSMNFRNSNYYIFIQSARAKSLVTFHGLSNIAIWSFKLQFATKFGSSEKRSLSLEPSLRLLIAHTLSLRLSDKYYPLGWWTLFFVASNFLR